MRSRSLGLLLLLTLLPTLASAAVLEVTNTNDAGPGSFREALLSANDGDRIEFRIPAPVPEAGWFTIRPQSLLPYVTKGVVIDGRTQKQLTGDTNPHGPEIEIDGSDAEHGPGLKFVAADNAEVYDLAINRFGGNGVVVERGIGVGIFGNHIGIDPSGTAARANGLNGVLFIDALGPRLGGNVISGNAGNGVYIVNSSHAEIAHNKIGAGRTTKFVVPNGANGINLRTFGTNIENNVITFNRDHGVTVDNRSGAIRIWRNEIWGNGYLSIDLGHDGTDVEDPLDLDRGANGHMNAPVLTHARAKNAHGIIATIGGRIRTVPNHEVQIDFYAAPHRSRLGLGETRVWVGQEKVVTNAAGVAVFEFDMYGWGVVPFVPGGYICATAAAPGAGEGTSELSEPIALDAPPRTFEVTTVADAGTGSLRAAIEAANAADCTREEPCWITFHVPEEELQEDVAILEPLSPLPPITREFVGIEGSSQRYWTRSHGQRPEVEIHGAKAGENATGLQIGTADAPVAFVSVRDLAVRGFGGDGIVLHQRRVRDSGLLLQRVETTAHHGNGLVMHGGSGTEFWNQSGAYGTAVAELQTRDNRGHGVVVHDDVNALSGVTARGNGGHGVFVRGSSVRVAGVIERNGAAGIATAPGSRAMFFEGVISGNGALGIDRNDDGVTPNDETEADGVLDAPVLLSAEYDAANRKTIIRGRWTQALPTLPERQIWSHRITWIRLYANETPDPSGHGEAERSAQPGPEGTWLYFVAEGDAIRAEVAVDLRGQWLTATRNMAFCFWEYGCGGADTSEISNAVKVE